MNLIVNFPDQESLSRRSKRKGNSSRSRAPSPRASVTFLNESTLSFVENLAHKYKQDIWFSKQEMKDFKRRTAQFLFQITSSNMSLADFAVQNIESGNDSSTFMGLECYLSTETLRSISERKRTVRRAIIQEHKRQVEMGIVDPEGLSRLAESLSEISARRARIIGRLHASEEK